MSHLKFGFLHRALKVGTLAVLTAAVLLTVGCAGNGNMSAVHGSGTGDPLHLGAAPGPLGSLTPAPIQIRFGSQPNDRIASLSLTLNSLQATNSGAGNIELLPEPVTFEFAHHAIVTSPISAVDIYQDTYSALVFPDMTGQVVFVDVNGTPIAQSFSVPAQSIPVDFVLGQNPLVLNVYLDLSQSFTIADFGNSVRRGREQWSPALPTQHSTFSVNAQLVLATETDAPNPVVGQPEAGSLDFMVGTVTAVDTQNQIISMKPRAGNAMRISYSTSGSTSFEGCGPTTLAGNLAELDGLTQTDGSLFATEVECINPTNFSELYGQLNGYAPEGTYYNLILDAGDGTNVTQSLIGSNITVDWMSQPGYRVNSGNLDLSGSQDLVFDESHVFPGQYVELENDTLAVPDPESSNAGYFQPLMFELEQQTLTGVVSGYSYDPQSQTGSFTLTVPTNSPLMAMNHGLTTVTVRQIPQTYLRNLSSITDGATLKVRGLMFVDPNCSNSNLEADPTMPVDFIMVASRMSR